MNELNFATRRLLEQMRDFDEPNEVDRVRVRSALAARLAAATAATAAVAGAAATSAAAPAGTVAAGGAAATKAAVAAGGGAVGGGALTKIAGTIAVVLAVGAGTTVTVHSLRSSPATVSPPAKVSQQPLRLLSPPSPVAEAPRALPSTVEEPLSPAKIPPRQVRPSAPHHRPPVALSPDPVVGPRVAAEASLITAASAAIQSGNVSAALATLDEHARRFPEGALAEEREALLALALVAAGRKDLACAHASRFLTTYPTSLHVPRIRAVCPVR